MELTIPRLVVAGTHSGVGKTTIVTGLLAAFKQRGLTVQSYKIGPDYIDPGYHRLASGQAAHNLDSWLVTADKLAAIFAKTAAGNDLVVIEGVMGLYDGGRDGVSSTADIAKRLAAPVVLVVDARGAGESVAAAVLGFKAYDPTVNLAGVIVNRLGSESHRVTVATALERSGVPVLGYIYRNDMLIVKERHLGLTPVEESDAIQAVAAMGEQVSREVALDDVLALARSAPALTVPQSPLVAPADAVRIGVAQDEAFSFYYPESLAVLAALGAVIVPFSPLRERRLPAVDGLIFGGGFPEMFAGELAANTALLQAVYRAAQQGMPIFAECGGLMYLAHLLTTFGGQSHPMAGVVPAVCCMQPKLQTVGYVEAAALTDNVLCRAGERLRGHEFHFSRMEIVGQARHFPWAFQFKKTRTGDVYPGGYTAGNVLASYLHLHFAGNEAAAARFLAQCRQYRQAGRRLP
jgi:cobyrinic acid a,c-diamide synthase